MVFDFETELWVWQARRDEGWTFVSLPEEASDEIRDITAGGPRRGFGAVRVRARIGSTTWRTSVFPGSNGSAYVLPVKAAVRKAESLSAGDVALVTVELL